MSVQSTSPSNRRALQSALRYGSAFIGIAVAGLIAVTAIAAEPDELETVRQRTAAYTNPELAKEAGWSILVPRCRDNQPEGGMGWHYANPSLLDDKVIAEQPEVLVYEPQQDGSQKLVAVEYVILFKDLPRSATPPTLFGHRFLQNDGDELWMLHVWLHRENPRGMFATWNPTVSCAHAGH